MRFSALYERAQGGNGRGGKGVKIGDPDVVLDVGSNNSSEIAGEGLRQL